MNRMIILLCAALTAACAGGQQDGLTLSGLKQSDFQSEADGKKTDLFILKNDNGMEVCVTNFGGRIVSVMVPDRDGIMRDVVLGFDRIADYETIPSDFGATIGRYANRIGQGRITLDSTEYQLPQNNYGHCLHGGPRGFQYRVFDAVQKSDREVELTYTAKDGEEGFPGNFDCRVTMTLTDDNAIDIRYAAETDKTTVVNMTNHSYFNLDGDPSKDNSEWLLTVNADSYTPVDSTFMTLGRIDPVEGTPFDFRQPTVIGARIDADDEQLRNGHGYDHNWVLSTAGDLSRPAARLVSPVTGIALEVFTDEPGIQVYVGNFLDGTVRGKGGIPYARRTAVCLETQHYPDSPNKPQWPSTVLRPGETYRSRCIYKFSVDK